jgi:hypothetical protein
VREGEEKEKQRGSGSSRMSTLMRQKKREHSLICSFHSFIFLRARKEKNSPPFLA